MAHSLHHAVHKCTAHLQHHTQLCIMVMQVVQAPSRQDTHNNWLVLDGAHTAQSATALAETVRELFPERPVALVVAMADDKDHKAVMAALRGVRPTVVLFTSVDIAGSSQR